MKRGVVLIAIGIIAIVVGGWLYAQGSGGHMMGGGHHMDFKPLAEITVPEVSGVALQGKQIFDNNCAACHGENASGNDGAGPPLVHRIYEPGHHGDQAIYLAVERGVRQHHWPFGDMPPIDGLVSNDVAKIIEYIRTLQRANGIY